VSIALKKMAQRSYKRVRLVSKRIELRPYKLSDFKTLQKSHLDRLLRINSFDEAIAIAAETDYEKFKKRIERHRLRGKNEEHFVFGIFERKTGFYIGQIDFFTFNKELRWGNLGYHIQNQFFGQGLASEAARLGLKAAFKFLGFHRIEASMEIKNKASEKVAINIGLRFEGKRLEFFPDKKGVDIKVYATNARDFKLAASK